MLRRRNRKAKRLRQLVSRAVERCKKVFEVEAGRFPTKELVEIIYEFCELSTGQTMFPFQEQFSKRVIRSVLENDGEEITALFSRQSGKTETIAITVGGMMIILPQLANQPMFANDIRLQMFRDGFWVGIFAPSQRQAQITYMRIRARIQSKAAQMIFSDPEFDLSFTTSNGTTVALSNNSFATAISASDGSSIEGESFKLILCEECQDISNYKILKSIHPMGAAYNATIVKIGTASNHRGNFYDAIQRNKADIAAGKVNSSHRNHFEYDWKVVVKYNPRYEKFILKEKKRMGEKSDEFRMSYGLEWIIERGMFIDIEKFEANNVERSLDVVPYDKSATHVAGIDLGKSGDPTLITITEVNWDMPVIQESRLNEETGEEEMYYAFNTYIKSWYEIQGVDDYEQQFPIIVDILKRYKIARVVIDATRESSVADRLRANTPYEVVPFVFTSKSKSELYKNLDLEIVSRRAKVPGSEAVVETPEYKKFIEQCGDLQKGYSGQYLVVAHPETRGAHDDYPDSWALSVWGCKVPCEVSNVQGLKENPFISKEKNGKMATRAVNRLTARRRGM